MTNLDTWNALARPPKEALKEIKGGRLSGKTDINPMWRYRAMTERFGRCGEGWKYTIDRLWTEPGTDGQVFQFAAVSLCLKENDGWSEPIPGVGGKMLLDKEKNGIHNNDEAPKMAVTDALGTAMKMIGVAADVYFGLWDGSKYRTPTTEPAGKKLDPPPTPKVWSKDDEAAFNAKCSAENPPLKADDFQEWILTKKESDAMTSDIWSGLDKNWTATVKAYKAFLAKGE